MVGRKVCLVRGPWRVCLGVDNRIVGETTLNFLKLIKPIKVEALCAMDQIVEIAPVQKTMKFKPQWFKSLPQYKQRPPVNFFDENDTTAKHKHMPNMRGCIGLTGLMSKGFILPMWCDLQMRVPESKDVIGWAGEKAREGVFPADQRTQVEPHHYAQYNGAFPMDLWYHTKIISPWLFRCKEEIEFAWIDPLWFRPESMAYYSLLPATLNYKYQTTTNINIMMRKYDKESAFYIAFQQPMVQVIPLSERDVSLKVEAISDKEFSRIAQLSANFTFGKKYQTLKRILKGKK